MEQCDGLVYTVDFRPCVTYTVDWALKTNLQLTGVILCVSSDLPLY